MIKQLLNSQMCQISQSDVETVQHSQKMMISCLTTESKQACEEFLGGPILLTNEVQNFDVHPLMTMIHPLGTKKYVKDEPFR